MSSAGFRLVDARGNSLLCPSPYKSGTVDELPKTLAVQLFVADCIQVTTRLPSRQQPKAEYLAWSSQQSGSKCFMEVKVPKKLKRFLSTFSGLINYTYKA
jgi:hypothetical protein